MRNLPSASQDRRRRETSSLWERVASSHSETERAVLREEVVVLNMSVAQAIAGRYRSRGISLDDLQQIACLGLVKAANGFDPSLEKDFLSYAVPTIRGEVKRHFRDLGWTVRPPRRIQELQARINAASDDTTQSLGGDARPSEIAARLGVDVSEVIEALTCNGFNPMSFDVPVGEPGSAATLGDLLASGGNDYDGVENAIVLREAFGSLSSRDLLILKRRFCDDRTQREIGDEIGLSQMQVSRVLTRILTRLRAVVEPTDADLDLSA